jgi:hypothetical protein
MEPLALSALSFDPVNLAAAVFTDSQTVRDWRRRALKLLVFVSLVLLLALLFAALGLKWHFDYVWRFEAAGLFGALVGTAELLSRYRDAPSFVLLSPPGLGYVLINAAASLGALGVILAFGWKFGATGGSVKAIQVLLAGFGAMALFRSSLLTVKAGSDDVGIGPSSVLSIMMAASDRSADRLRAADRAGRVHEVMDGVVYAKAHDALPTVAVALMQNLSPADIASLNADLAGLKNIELPDATKALLLGLKLTNVVSVAVLAAAKASLGDTILGVPGSDVARASLPVNGAAAQDPQTAAAVPVPATTTTTDPIQTADLPQTPQTPDPDSGDGHHTEG